MKNVIFECNDSYFTELDLLIKLGLDEEIQNTCLMNKTERILENWEKGPPDLQRRLTRKVDTIEM